VTSSQVGFIILKKKEKERKKQQQQTMGNLQKKST
jgi:hypothetical protein